MPSREIGRGSWNEYLSSLSRLYLNHPVSLHLVSDELGDQVVAEHVPLLGIAPERAGERSGMVGVALGRAGSTDTMLHEIPGASRVLVREAEDGTPQALDIEGEDPTSHGRIKAILIWD